MSIPFGDRNPVMIGAICLVAILVIMLGAFRADQLPLIGAGNTYYADFSDASGIKPDDEVRIAGVRVGKVTDVGLRGDRVRVTFKVDKGTSLGPTSRAQIKVKTLLGNMFMALQPRGSGQLETGSTIPLKRTQSAYDIVQVFSTLADRTQRIDVNQLKESLNTVADATKGTPQAFQDSLRGLSRLSANVAEKDEQIRTLLGNLRKVTGILKSHDQDIVALMRDSDTLMRALVARRDSVHRLLVSTSTLSKELAALVRQTRGDLKPALTNLESVVAMLEKNQQNLDESLRLMAPFYRVFANLLGNGPWFDTWIANLPPMGTPEVSYGP